MFEWKLGLHMYIHSAGNATNGSSRYSSASTEKVVRCNEMKEPMRNMKRTTLPKDPPWTNPTPTRSMHLLSSPIVGPLSTRHWHTRRKPQTHTDWSSSVNQAGNDRKAHDLRPYFADYPVHAVFYGPCTHAGLRNSCKSPECRPGFMGETSG